MPSPGGCSHKPELATGEGVDTGTRAALRGKLGDRPAAGQQALAETLLADLAAIDALDTAWLDPATGTTVEVIRSAYRTALDGFALPYGDVAVGSRRNTPSAISSRSHSAPAAWWPTPDSTPSAGPARRRSTGSSKPTARVAAR